MIPFVHSLVFVYSVQELHQTIDAEPNRTDETPARVMPKRSHEDTELVSQGCQEGGAALADPTILPGARRVLSPFLEIFFYDPNRDYEPRCLAAMTHYGHMSLMVVVGGGKPSYEMTAQESLSLLFEWLANPDEFARQAAMSVCRAENLTAEATCMRTALAYAAPNTLVINALPECLCRNPELVLAEDICGKLMRLGTACDEVCINALILIAFEYGAPRDTHPESERSPSEKLYNRAMDSLLGCLAPGRCSDKTKLHIIDSIFQNTEQWDPVDATHDFHHTLLSILMDMGQLVTLPSAAHSPGYIAYAGMLILVTRIPWNGARETTVLAMTTLLKPAYLVHAFPSTWCDDHRTPYYRYFNTNCIDLHENVVHLALEVLRSYVASCAGQHPPQQPFASVAPAVFAALMTLFTADTENGRVRESAMHLLNDMATHSVEFRRILRSRRADVRFVLDDVMAQNICRYANGTAESVPKLAAAQAATLTAMATVNRKLTEAD
jgi:hypothetical protein